METHAPSTSHHSEREHAPEMETESRSVNSVTCKHVNLKGKVKITALLESTTQELSFEWS